MERCSDRSIRFQSIWMGFQEKYLPEELRYLHWHKYPLKTLPCDFEPKNLIELSLPYGKVEQIWEGKKKAFKLKSVVLHHSQYLLKMPDLSESPNVERTNLLNCTNFSYISSSIHNFNHLSRLCFRGCKSVRSFPSNLHFVCPVTINFGDCVNLTEFPQISGNVTKLILWGTAIKEVPSSVGCLTNLKFLSLSQCTRLKRVSTSICKLKSLQMLYLIECFNLENFPEILEKMEHLNQNALGRTEIRELPSTFEKGEGIESQLPSSVADSNELSLYLRNYALNGCLSSLECLDLSGNDFESLPASIKQLSRLRNLYLCFCHKLLSIPELPLSLKWLDASNCERLQTLPEIPSCLEEVDASVLERLSKHYRDMNDYRRGSPRDSSIEFWFNNCLKLNEKADNNSLADSKLRIRHMAIASLRLPYKLEVVEPRKLRDSAIIIPGSQIPEWFINQSSGSKITLQLPHHCCQNLIGFAVSFVLVPRETIWDGLSIGGICDFEMNTLSGKKYVRRCLFMNTCNGFTNYSDHVMVGFNVCGIHFGFPDDNHHTTVSFEFDSLPDNEMKCCGVCPVYANPSETKPNTFTLNFAAEN